MSKYVFCLCLAFFIARPAIAAEPSKSDTFAPEIARLIEKLGDADPAVRHAAGKRLREIGRVAVPQLRAAADSSDPQVRLEVRDALNALDRPPLPDGSGTRHDEKAVSYDDVSSTIDIIDGKRTIRVFQMNGKYGIHTDIKITITGPVEGKPTKQVIQARDAEHLKWEAPEIWKIYNRHFNIEADMAATHREHPHLEAWVNRQIKSAKLSPEDAKALKAKMKEFIDANNEDVRAAYFKPELQAKRSEITNQKSDEFRKLAADLKLPPPGDDVELEPPAQFRLGIVYSDDSDRDRPPDVESGIVIRDIIPNSRAARLGIRPGDILQKVNGVDVNSGFDLQKANALRQDGTDADVVRDFKPVHLIEKR